jgi:hypothetical protein
LGAIRTYWILRRSGRVNCASWAFTNAAASASLTVIWAMSGSVSTYAQSARTRSKRVMYACSTSASVTLIPSLMSASIFWRSRSRRISLSNSPGSMRACLSVAR